MMLEVFSLAKSIAEKSPVAVQGTKRSLIYSRDHSVQEGLNHVVCSLKFSQLPIFRDNLITSTTIMQKMKSRLKERAFKL